MVRCPDPGQDSNSKHQASRCSYVPSRNNHRKSACGYRILYNVARQDQERAAAVLPGYCSIVKCRHVLVHQSHQGCDAAPAFTPTPLLRPLRKADVPHARGKVASSRWQVHSHPPSTEMSTPGWLQLGVAALLLPPLLLLVLLLVSLTSRASKILWLCWRYRDIPGRTPHLLFGNLGDMIKLGGADKSFKYYADKYGPICKIFFMHHMFIVVADPDLAHQMLVKSNTRPALLSPATDLMPGKTLALDKSGLVFARSELWRMLRPAWQPAFAPGSLAQYMQLMTAAAQQLVQVMSGAVLNTPGGANYMAGAQANGNDTSGVTSKGMSNVEQYVDIHELFSRMTLDVVGTCAYGVRFNALKGSDVPDVAHTGLSGIGPTLQRSLKDFFQNVPLSRGSKWGWVLAMLPTLKPLIAQLARTFPDVAFTKMLKSRMNIMATTYTLIDDWRSHGTAKQNHKSTPTNPVSTGAGADQGHGLHGVQPGSFLSLLLEAQQKAALNKSPEQMTDETIAAQAAAFIVAGTETTGNTLTYAIYLLCQHPDKLERLLHEVDAHGRDKPTGPDDEFPYTSAAINETMRLMPAAHATTRKVDQPQGMQLGSHHIDCGVELVAPIYAMHRDPKWWPRAEEFLPERWLPEGQAELGARHPYAYTPFGTGPRQCIGFKFALQEARIALVQVFKHFTFKLQPGQVPLAVIAGFTVSPKNGLMVQVIPRTSVKAA